MSEATREAYARPQARRIVEVPLPEVGRDAHGHVRAVSARDLAQLREAHGGQGKSDNLPFVHDLLARTLCSAEGVLLYGSAAEVAAEFDLGIESIEALVSAAFEASGVRLVPAGN